MDSPGQFSTLKQLLFTDMATASGRTEDLPREKVIAKPKLVLSKMELLNAEKGDVSRALSPQLSRSNARSRCAIFLQKFQLACARDFILFYF